MEVVLTYYPSRIVYGVLDQGEIVTLAPYGIVCVLSTEGIQRFEQLGRFRGGFIWLNIVGKQR